MMRRRWASTEALAVGRVIGDVIDDFAPSAEMVVAYHHQSLTQQQQLRIINGAEIGASDLLLPPRVSIIIHNNNSPSIPPLAPANPRLFTLIMTDPDAPSPSEPSCREHVHWIVTDIPDGGEASQGIEILHYEPPKPLIGIHRYVFILFKQDGPLLVMPPSHRDNFKTREFANICNLGLPVAAIYFNAQKKIGGRRR